MSILYPKVHPKGYQIDQNGDKGVLNKFNFTPNEGHSLPQPSPSLPQTPKVVQSDSQMDPKTITKCIKIDIKEQRVMRNIFYLLVKTHIEQQRGRRKLSGIPIFFGVLSVFNRKQLFCVMIVCPT